MMLTDVATMEMRRDPVWFTSPSATRFRDEAEWPGRILVDWIEPWQLPIFLPVSYTVYTQDIDLPDQEAVEETASLGQGDPWTLSYDAVYGYALNQTQVRSQSHTEEDILGEMVSHDLVVRMPPRKRFSVKLRLQSVTPAIPTIVSLE